MVHSQTQQWQWEDESEEEEEEGEMQKPVADCVAAAGPGFGARRNAAFAGRRGGSVDTETASALEVAPSPGGVRGLAVLDPQWEHHHPWGRYGPRGRRGEGKEGGRWRRTSEVVEGEEEGEGRRAG